jgi:hypothetical protein
MIQKKKKKLLEPQTHAYDRPYWMAFLVTRDQWLVKDRLGLSAPITCIIALVDRIQPFPQDTRRAPSFCDP